MGKMGDGRGTDNAIGRPGVAGWRAVQAVRSHVAVNDRAVVGRRYPDVRFVVDAQRVRAFADAIGHPDAASVPPTLVTAPEIEAGLAHVLADPELGIALTRVLHGDQQYEWFRSLTVGETVTASATIEDVRGRLGLEFLVLRTEVRDADGELVCVGRTTLIVRDAA